MAGLWFVGIVLLWTISVGWYNIVSAGELVAFRGLPRFWVCGFIVLRCVLLRLGLVSGLYNMCI